MAISFGPAAVFSIVLAGFETAPSCPTEVEILQLLFAKAHTGLQLPSSSVTHSLAASAIGSLLWFLAQGGHFENNRKERVVSKRSGVFSESGAVMTRLFLMCDDGGSFSVLQTQEVTKNVAND